VLFSAPFAFSLLSFRPSIQVKGRRTQGKGSKKALQTKKPTFRGSESREKRKGEAEMTQTAFETCEVVNIQMVRERKLLYNGDRVSTPEQAAEAFCANERG
jgi:hypothetical protein